MKRIIVALFILFTITTLMAEVSLNKFGRIETNIEKTNTNYYRSNGEYYIDTNGLTMIGTDLFPTSEGYLTLTSEHENLPTWLRVYDNSGRLIETTEYPKVINLQFSNNLEFAVFSTSKKVVSLNMNTLDSSSSANSLNFAVNNAGEVLVKDSVHSFKFRNQSYQTQNRIINLFFWNEIPTIITESGIYQINDELVEIEHFDNGIHEAKVLDNKLYLVIKDKNNFQLFRFNDFSSKSKIDEVIFERTSSRVHAPINSPLNYEETDYPSPIGNSYAEIQQYGDSSYLHPGVDYLGDDYQDVYAVQDGFVKAVLTTGGDPYWRVAISGEDTPEESEGYLYAHLNQSSISVNIGDYVNAGDVIGTLYAWNYYDFTHIHFSRVFCTGEEWMGNWWARENNLLDAVNFLDETAPVFEDAIEGQKFAFRNDTGAYLEQQNLSGQFDIIAKCYDIANSDWKIDLHDISYSLHPFNNPDSTLFQSLGYVYDFDLDTYADEVIDAMILNTIYSRDATCFSTGNYEEREYYHIVTNNNGDSLITAEDAAYNFDSTQFPDNIYYLKVTARDASLNTTTDSMMVIFNNGVDAEEEEIPETAEIKLSNHPNPFNPTTEIRFTAKNAEDAKIEIYNIRGQYIVTLSDPSQMDCIEGRQTHSISRHGTDTQNNPVASGIYYAVLKSGENVLASRKMVLLK